VEKLDSASWYYCPCDRLEKKKSFLFCYFTT